MGLRIIFNDKAGIKEDFFAHHYTPHIVRNPEIDPLKTKLVNKDGYVSSSFSLAERQIFAGVPLQEVIDNIVAKGETLRPQKTWFMISWIEGMYGVYTFNSQTGNPEFYSDKIYPIFYKHMSFHEILYGLEEDETSLTNESLKLIKDAEAGNSVAVLKLIKEYPVFISINKSVADYFTDIMEIAKYHPSYKKMTEARDLLKKHLIPKSPHGETYLPKQTVLTFQYIKKLAVFLSDTCKKIADVSPRKKDNRPFNKDVYEVLISWARDKKEYRVSTLSFDALKELVIAPKEFAKRLLADYFKISIRTLEKHLTKSTR